MDTKYDSRNQSNRLDISNYREPVKTESNYETKSWFIQKKHNRYRNMRNLKKMIFPPIEEHKINFLMIDEESISYITFANSAQEITNVIMNNLYDFPAPQSTESVTWDALTPDKKMKELVITDMTAGVGGNVLNFACCFKYVNAVEIEKIRYDYLKKNIGVYEHLNVNCYNGDSVKFLIEGDSLIQDIVFFDPPWGGKDYKLHTNLRLLFSTQGAIDTSGCPDISTIDLNDPGPSEVILETTVPFTDFSIENIIRMLFQKEKNKMIVAKLPNNYDFVFFTEELKDYKVSYFNLDRMTMAIIKNY
jgi:predicted RNA methylase